MSWADQSGAHKIMHRVAVAVANITFAMPALASVMLLVIAGLNYYYKGRWETPSLLKFMRDFNPHFFEGSSTMAKFAGQVPMWLFFLALSLLIFAWAAESSRQRNKPKKVKKFGLSRKEKDDSVISLGGTQF